MSRTSCMRTQDARSQSKNQGERGIAFTGGAGKYRESVGADNVGRSGNPLYPRSKPDVLEKARIDERWRRRQCPCAEQTNLQGHAVLCLRVQNPGQGAGLRL